MRTVPYSERANIAQLEFLGAEFLTWLYIFLDKESAETTLEQVFETNNLARGAKVALGNKISLTCLQYEGMKTTVTGPMLDDSAEVWSAMRGGFLISSLALVVAYPNRSFTVVLKDSGSALSGIKIIEDFDKQAIGPSADTESENEGADLKNREEIFLRLSALDEVEAVIDAIFAHFLSLRLANNFSTTVIGEMRAVVMERLSQIAVKGQAFIN